MATGTVTATREEIASPAPPPPAVPPRDNGAIADDGVFGYAPDGSKFAARIGPGFIILGATRLSAFVASAGGSLSAMTPSLLRVIEAVSINEGRLEALNSYDSNFMSFGVFQWTAGGPDEPGELAGLLERIKRADDACFNEYFRSFRLDTELTAAGKRPSGFLTLGGSRLVSAAEKATMRSALWAYRFWRAGHDYTVRKCQIEHAISRLDAFYDDPIPAGGKTRSLHEYISSECGIALILDEHVNRPGHVPKTLAGAIARRVEGGGRADPSSWTSDDERRVLQIYLEDRARTSMENSASRAATIAKSTSAERGSFVRS